MRRLLLFIFIGLSMQVAKAQNNQRISIAAMTESMAFPFTRFTPLHPGMEMSYELNEKKHTNRLSNMNLQLGWYFHRKVENAFYLKAEWAVSFKISDSFTADVYYGAGYMHVFYPGKVYELNPDSGTFESIKQTGRPHLLANAGLGFTYRNSSALEPFIRQDFAIETPFANGIPVMVHSFLKAGTHIKLQQK
ncbi:MAG: hypothetical protein VYB44_13500 [Bacteroidota bacterium]|nr:hypothetical protein [Bacteroidota bacterium]